MELKSTLSSIFSIFIIFALIFNAEQEIFAHSYALSNDSVVKAVDSTLTINDDFEVEKAFNKEYSFRKKLKNKQYR